MNAKTRRIVLITGGLTTAVVIGVGGAVVWAGTGTGPSGAKSTSQESAPVPPGTVAQDFITAFTTGDTAKAAATTDAEQVAAPALAKTKAGMTAESKFQARLGPVSPAKAGETTTKLTADVSWTLPGGAPWKYQVALDLKLDGERWRVHWAPALLHPSLVEGQSLAFLPQSGDGALLDRDGQPVPKDTGAYAAAIMPGVRTAVGSLNGEPGW